MMTFEEFTAKIHRTIDLDLSKYKENQLKRRVTQFMNRYELASFSSFFDLLEKDAHVLSKFRDYITINTSEFFRDTKVYRYIEKQILAHHHSRKPTYKIWSAGCSVGAEPYTLAMLAMEKKISRINITATDYDRSVLKKAKEGIYTKSYLKNLPDQYLRKYFTEDKKQYRILPEVKKNVTFQEHNLLSDRFLTSNHLILCRNVFIYFTHEVQMELVRKFAAALQPGGYLIIGSSEFIPVPETYGFEKEYYSIYKKAL